MFRNIFYLLTSNISFSAAERSALVINTFDGKRSPYHPSVLFFEDGWNGWRYWMAETPFSYRTKPYIDRNECPSIHVSNDGIHWTEPEGLINPLENLSEQQVKELDYFSDPCLVKGPDGCIELWYRLTERGGDFGKLNVCSLRRRVSYDGVSWSPVEIMVQLNENQPCSGLGNVVVSPAIVWDNEHGYRIWFVDLESSQSSAFHGVSFAQSTDGKKWSDFKSVSLDRAVNPWHIDVQIIDGEYLMTIYDFCDVSVWTSKDEFKFNYRATLLKPQPKVGSIRNSFYKSCLMRDDKGYKLYFSAHDGVDTHIGLLQGIDIDSMQAVITDGISIWRQLRTAMYYQRRRVRFIIKNILNGK